MITLPHPLSLPTLLGLSLLLCSCVAPHVGRTVDASLPSSPNSAPLEARQFGPFYEHITAPDGSSRTSLRPLLYTHIESPKDNASLTEVLWPLYASHSLDSTLNWRFLTVYGRNADTNDPASASHLWAFPLWFHGRTSNGQDYAALFPLYGTLRDFLSYDRFSFTLWPLYSTAEKYGIHSTYILWPIYSHAEGKGIHNTRVFPFWGHITKQGAWDRSFLLWPIWNQATYFKGDSPDGSAWTLFPFAGHTDRPTVEAWQVLPPLFQVARGRGRFQGDRQILAPWPLVRISDIRDTHKRHFYPFYATTWTTNTSKTTVLWPFYHQSHAFNANLSRREWTFAPLFHRTLVQDHTDSPQTLRSYTRFWPLFSHVHEKDGSFFRFLDFSLHRRVGALERNLLQMPVLYTHGHQNNTHEDELLWGLFRWVRTPSQTQEFQLWPLYHSSRSTPNTPPSWSILYGLYGRENHPSSNSRKTRLLWLFSF